MLEPPAVRQAETVAQDSKLKIRSSLFLQTLHAFASCSCGQRKASPVRHNMRFGQAKPPPACGPEPSKSVAIGQTKNHLGLFGAFFLFQPQPPALERMAFACPRQQHIGRLVKCGPQQIVTLFGNAARIIHFPRLIAPRRQTGISARRPGPDKTLGVVNGGHKSVSGAPVLLNTMMKRQVACVDRLRRQT